MTDKEIYCMGRAEFLAESKGITLTEASKVAEQEWNAQQGGKLNGTI